MRCACVALDATWRGISTISEYFFLRKMGLINITKAFLVLCWSGLKRISCTVYKLGPSSLIWFDVLTWAMLNMLLAY